MVDPMKGIWGMAILVNIIVAAFFVISITMILGTKTFDATLRIKDRIGFSADTNMLDFGTLRPGDREFKEIIISNNFDFPAKIDLTANGAIAPFLVFSEDNFWLQPNENRTIKIFAVAPPKVRFGIYYGQITVLFRRI